MSPADWLRFLTELADRADELALRWFRTAGLRVQEKPDLSPVTEADQAIEAMARDRKSTRLNSSHSQISYAVFCLKKKKKYAQYERETVLPYLSSIPTVLYIDGLTS